MTKMVFQSVDEIPNLRARSRVDEIAKILPNIKNGKFRILVDVPDQTIAAYRVSFSAAKKRKSTHSNLYFHQVKKKEGNFDAYIGYEDRS